MKVSKNLFRAYKVKYEVLYLLIDHFLDNFKSFGTFNPFVDKYPKYKFRVFNTHYNDSNTCNFVNNIRQKRRLQSWNW